jgi:hypothetical protein
VAHNFDDVRLHICCFSQYHKNMHEEHTILEKGFFRACQSSVPAVKNHLFKAVRLENKEVEVDFACGKNCCLWMQ